MESLVQNEITPLMVARDYSLFEDLVDHHGVYSQEDFSLMSITERLMLINTMLGEFIDFHNII